MKQALDMLIGVASAGFVKLGKAVGLDFGTTGILGIRNTANSAYAKLRAADPEGDDDVVTKRHYDANLPSAGATNGIKTIKFGVGTSSVTATEEIPSGAYIHRVDVKIVDAYSSGATLSVGSAASASSLLGEGVIDEETANDQTVANLIMTAPATFAPKVTIGGSPSAGSALVVVHYSEPNT